MIKTGLDSPDISRRGLEDHTNFQGTYTFSSLQDYLANRPYSFVQQAGQDKVIFWEKVLAGFVLDDIRLRPNLTVSLAARYDWQNYFHDKNNVSPRIERPCQATIRTTKCHPTWFEDRVGSRRLVALTPAVNIVVI
jgi:outer membrane receptor protein involved in Fe transport